MIDKFRPHAFAPDAPANGAFPITPSDSANLPQAARRLYIGGAGDLVVTLRDGSAVKFANVPAGTELNVTAVKVAASGTTATNVVGLI